MLDQHVEQISPAELDQLLDQASDEGWPELVLLGPHYSLSDDTNRWPDDIKNASRGFQLNALVPGLAEKLVKLTNLISLNLDCNGINDDGAKAIAKLAKLTTLNLSGNSIGDAGAKAIANLTNLTTLHLDNNSIGVDGAKAIAKLDNLTSLYLDNNVISVDGAEAIANLTKLRSLTLNYNMTGDDGVKALASLTNLTSLHLSGNIIGDDSVKAIAASLPDLKTLYLDNNSLGAGGAEAIANLTHLTSLNLDYNDIGDDGAEAIADLANLTALHLSNNGIGDGGARAIAQLDSLVSLNLRGNTIGVDGALAILSAWEKRSETHHLVSLDLQENGDLSELLPEEVLSRAHDPQAILAAYRRFSGGSKQSLNEAKLLVVGNEAVGKTSLLHFLTENKPRDPDEKKTPGVATHEKIDTRAWSPKESDIRLNVWDFGGQEMMRGTHRFFLTARSFYLLVLEDRRQDDRSILDWLKTIRNRAAGSPILVVINKSDGGKEELRLDENGLRRKYPEIIGFLRASCNDDDYSRESIRNLRQKIIDTVINDERLQHARDELPSSWIEIKNEVTALAEKKAVLSIQDFNDLCISEEVGAEVTDENEQRALLQLLHDLGTIIAYGLDQDAPSFSKEINLLDPNWLTGAIYQILNHPSLRDQHGEFTSEQMKAWLDPEIYPEERHSFILGMMQDEELGLCFRLTTATREERYLIPEALPASKPDYEGIWPEDSLRFRFHYGYLPPGLMPRFLVEAHRNQTENKTRWRRGGVFVAAQCKVLVEADMGASPQKIDIAVTGPQKQRRAALAVILNYLQQVHEFNRECEPKARVPLSDQPDRDVSYDHLLRLEALEGSDHSFLPEGADRIHTVSELLDGVRLEFAPGQDGELQQGDFSKAVPVEDPVMEVFVSYTWRNEESVTIVDRLEQAFDGKDITLIRDKSELIYRDSIRDFMEQLGRGKCIVIVLSEDYLKSDSCMFELTEIADRGEMYDRVFPIVLSDTQLSEPLKRIDYVAYWEKKKKTLNDRMNEVGNEHLEGIRETIDLYTKIRNTVANLMNILGDMNVLTSDQHRDSNFSALFEALERRLAG